MDRRAASFGWVVLRETLAVWTLVSLLVLQAHQSPVQGQGLLDEGRTQLVSRGETHRKPSLRNQAYQYLKYRNRTLTGPTPSHRDSGLFPVVFNLAARADITANATCGQDEPEHYCKLVNHVRREPSEGIQCGVCNEHGHDMRDSHSIENAIDGSNNWWQSPTIAKGRQFNHVTITLDLKQIYQVAYVIVKAANSPRPGNWVLERSVDGVTYMPWQYYALSDSDCWNLYNVQASSGIPEFERDDDVICTSAYSKLDPLENGEIHTSLINGRPGVDGPSEELMEFTRARYVRLRMQKIRTLNADFMTFIYNDPRDLDPSVTNRYFYSIKDIWIGGQCMCHGHASVCPHDADTGELQCQCEDNTCGSTCEQCCPLFNQEPWKAASYEESAMCEECNCFNHADACYYNETVAEHHLSVNIWGEYSGGGVCIDCQHHTMGINCEMCEDGFYRPAGIAQFHPEACHMCLCDTIGAANNLCVKDSSLEPDGIFAGDCFCREGYCGPRCEECSSGYTGYPYCQPCPCSSGGSLNEDVCQEPCHCKSHVEGIRCDACIPGYYNLDWMNPKGCQPCFCFAISDQCHSSTWGSIQLTNLNGWMVTDLAGTGEVTPNMTEDGSLVVDSHQVEALNRAIYWKAPGEFTGNILTSYGALFEFEFCYGVNVTEELLLEEEPYLANYDVILEGSGMSIAHGGQYYEETITHMVSMNLTESGWHHLQDSSSPAGTMVSREDFQTLLVDVDRLLVRATYHMYQNSASLQRVSMDMALEDGMGPPIPSVEHCICPAGYAGTSCEDCAPGYRRAEDILYGGECIPCDCHGHSDHCDPFTGECIECVHHTMGDHCEECEPGYHGDATTGEEDCCSRCACPLDMPSNNFAQGCAPSTDGENEYECVGCQPGYMGRFCELCAPGYYGNPMLPGNHCQPCDCRGNTDPYEVDICDRFTGRCHECQGNSEGFHCELCKEGFYGTAENFDCKACACNPYGSEGAQCDPKTGQCPCRPDYNGRDCGQCWPGYGNIELGCPACNCSASGAVEMRCDPVTGQCPCLPGVGGLHCTRCLPGFYGYGSRRGCTACGCNLQGAAQTGCDSGGYCTCKANVVGQKCDQCEPGYWGLETGQGCQPCDCNSTGSTSRDCDPWSGQCRCASGVTGQKCDQCRRGYYGFSEWGCELCEPCNKPGHVCDPQTGTCVCPALTRGDACQECQPDAWGYDPFHGCKPCDCNSTGSWSTTCDPSSGQCECQNSYSGRQCDRCHFGHYGFPRCKPCHCHVAGTRQEDCDEKGHCQCDMEGQCPCKENVSGKKCRTCKSRTFSLQDDNPKGCTSCFCFERSKDCRQAPYKWEPVQLLSRKEVTVVTGYENPLQPTNQGFLVIPADATSVVIRPEDQPRPLYWELSTALRGDWTTSYGGKLTFDFVTRTRNGEESPTASMAPLVHLKGNYVLDLFWYPESDQELVMREDLFVNEVGTRAMRADLMVLLQNLQGIMVKVGDTAFVDGVVLENVFIDGAVEDPRNPSSAFGIEECVCPSKYTGLSCQNPANGYYRKRPDTYPDGPDPVDLIGVSMPCLCHGHSQTCDRETGACSECRDHTTGSHCQLCAPGYYGNATQGTPTDCQPCACPFLPPDSFSQACHVDGRGELVCDGCMEGYIGIKCDKCSLGYYGDPNIRGGRCVPCGCNSEGAVSNGCDSSTGQCTCVAGISGRACDECSPRHVLVDGQCQSCDTGCGGILLQDLDQLNTTVREFDASAETFIPWSRLYIVDGLFSQLHPRVRRLNPVNVDSNVEDLKSEIRDAQRRAQRLEDESDYLKKKSREGDTEREDIEDEATDLLAVLEDSQEKLSKAVEQLEEQLQQGPTDLSGDFADVLRQAEDYLKRIKEADFEAAEVNALNSLELDKEALEEIRRFDEDHQLDTEETAEDVEEIIERLEEEHSTLTDTVQRDNEDSAYTNVNNKRKIYSIRSQLDELVEVEGDLKSGMANAEMTNEDSSHLLWNISSSNFQGSMDLLRKLEKEKRNLDIKSGLLEQSLPGLEELVTDAQAHADDLEQQAHSLEHLFSETRHAAADPVKAAKAFEDIAQAIAEAEEVVEESRNAVQNASDTVAGDGNNGPLYQQVQDARQRSEDLKKRSKDLKKAERGLQPRESDVQDLIGVMEQNQEETQAALSGIEMKLNNMSTAGLERPVSDLKHQADVATARAQAASGRTMDIQQVMETDMKPKLEELKALTAEGLRRTNAQVSAAKAQFEKLANLTDTLTKRTDAMKRQKTEVEVNLTELKERIKQARQQAKSIKVSLYHEGDCIRRYEPEIEAGTSNTIRLHFKTNRTRSAQLLFLLHDPRSGDYLSLGVVDKKVVFSWNVGGGSATIEHPLVIEPAKKFRDDDQWYSVEADRIGNVGKLRVKKLTEETEADERTTFAPATHIKLDVESDTRLYVGGLPEGYLLPGEVVSTQFQGCIGEVYLDGKPVGLYNFRHLEPVEGNSCSGCAIVPTYTPPGEYQFDGDGYAQLDQEIYDDEKFGIFLHFKTFWKDSLMFFMGNEDTGDFTSVEMRSGQVVFRYSFQGRSSVVIQTDLGYNMNKWIKVKAQRIGLEGVLEVNGFNRKAKAEDIGTSRLDLGNSDLYFAGLPPTVEISRYGNITSSGFVGCLREVTKSSRGTRTLDLWSGLHIGMTPGCLQKARTIGLEGIGYLDLPSPDLLHEGDISFSFRTLQSEALLMLAIARDEEKFYSVSLMGGQIQAWFSAGDGVATIATDETYNDGLVHSVSVLKILNLIELYVDDKFIDSAMLPGSDSVIDTMKGSYGGLYIGGLPPRVVADGKAASLEPLTGCLSDLVINGKLLPLDAAVDYLEVDVGRCAVSRIFPNLTIPEAGEDSTKAPGFTVTVTSPPDIVPEPGPTPGFCASEGTYYVVNDAASFGDVRHSHAELVVQRGDVNKDFTISMEFRTYAARGLVFYITNEDQTEYIAVQLEDGKVDLSYAARGQSRAFASDQALHDGRWHLLKVTKDRKLITIEIDSFDPQQADIRRKIDVIAPIYVGGLPDVYQPREGLVSASFQGCMRNFYLNDQHVDLFNSKSVMGVSLCYTTVERGVHFDGQSLAIYAEEYHIISDFKVSFSFRTVEQDAILLTTSSPFKEPALGLELYQGKLIFTVINSGGRFSTESDVCEFCLCDNQWHSVSAEMIKNVVTMTVDGREMKPGASEGYERSLNSDYELYIGGYPAYAKPQAAIHTDKYFRGCIKDLTVNNTLVDWQSDVEDLYDVHVGACPVGLP